MLVATTARTALFRVFAQPKLLQRDGPVLGLGQQLQRSRLTITKTETVADVGSLTTTCTVLVYAGGNSSAKAF